MLISAFLAAGLHASTEPPPSGKSSTAAVEVSVTASAQALIQQADSLKVSSYLGVPGTAFDLEEYKKFQAQFDALIEANQQIKFIDDAVSFKTWWQKNETEILIQRAKMGADITMQGLLVNSYLYYKMQNAKSEMQVTGLVKWIDQQATSPILRRTSAYTIAILTSVLGFIGGVIWGAAIAGLFASFVSAFLEPMARPLREKVALLGNRLFSKRGVALNTKLFAHAESQSKDQLAATRSEQSYQQAKSMMLQIGLDFNAKEFENNVKRIEEAFNLANQVWMQTLPPAYQGGRNAIMDTFFFRTQTAGMNVLQGIQGAETHLQGIERIAEKIEARTGKLDSAEPIVYKILDTLREIQSASGKPEEIKTLRSKLEAQKVELLNAGANTREVERIVNNGERALVFERHAAYSLAAAVFHDAMHAEYRQLPIELMKPYLAFRKGFALDYFTRLFVNESVRILNEVGYVIHAVKDAV